MKVQTREYKMKEYFESRLYKYTSASYFDKSDKSFRNRLNFSGTYSTSIKTKCIWKNALWSLNYAATINL